MDLTSSNCNLHDDYFLSASYYFESTDYSTSTADVSSFDYHNVDSDLRRSRMVNLYS